MPRKPHSNAVLHHLPMEQQKELCEWLLDDGMSYRAAAKMLLAEFKVKSSPTALHDYFHSFCAPELLRRRATAVSTADDVADEAAATPGRWDQATLDRIKQSAFEMMLTPGASAKDVKTLYSVVFKAKDQALAEEKAEQDRQKLELDREKLELEKRRVALQEDAAAEAKAKLVALATNAKSKGGLTPETLAEIEAAAGLL